MHISLPQYRVKTALKLAENSYVSDEVSKYKNKPCSLWKVVNRCIPSKSKAKPSYSKNTLAIANEFNHYFSSVGPSTSILRPLNWRMIITSSYLVYTPIALNTDPVNEQFNFRPVPSTEVDSTVLSMPSNKSSGIDQISMRVLKDCLPTILPALTDIINI